MIDHRDPEARQLIAEKKAKLDADFKAGRMGEPTYLLSLRILRVPNIQQELRDRKLEIEIDRVSNSKRRP